MNTTDDMNKLIQEAQSEHNAWYAKLPKDGSYYASKFVLTDGDQFEGFSEGHFWNGWDCPLFTRETVIRIFEYLNEQDRLAGNDKDGIIWLYEFTSDGTLVWIDPWFPDEMNCYEDSPITIEYKGESLVVYDVGSYGWTWYDITRP